jgi:hypothetical protein
MGCIGFIGAVNSTLYALGDSSLPINILSTVGGTLALNGVEGIVSKKTRQNEEDKFRFSIFIPFPSIDRAAIFYIMAKSSPVIKPLQQTS